MSGKIYVVVDPRLMSLERRFGRLSDSDLDAEELKTLVVAAWERRVPGASEMEFRVELPPEGFRAEVNEAPKYGSGKPDARLVYAYIRVLPSENGETNLLLQDFRAWPTYRGI